MRVFTSAAWSLLNVHRDVLRELDLHMEELSSWTPRGLRREILRIILAQPAPVRDLLIKRWRHRVEDRRGQILSLLAITVFRPEMPGDELSGDDPDRIRQFVHAAGTEVPNPAATAGHQPGRVGSSDVPRRSLRHVTALRGALWFLELWYGFYLPQILSLPQSGAEGRQRRRRQRANALISVGWNLKSGAARAISAGMTHQDVSSTTGMMRLDPEAFRCRPPRRSTGCKDDEDRQRLLLRGSSSTSGVSTATGRQGLGGGLLLAWTRSARPDPR